MFTASSMSPCESPVDEHEPKTSELLETTMANCQQLAGRLQRNMVTSDKNLVEENARLRAVNQDITESNRRWQLLNEQRDHYVQKLMKHIQELQNENGGRYSPSAPQQNTIDYSENLQQQNNRLLEESRNKSIENEELRRKIVQMNKQMEYLKSSHSEHVELLEIQVRAHRDDWEAEKQERLEAQRRKSQILDELKRANDMIRELQEQLKQKEVCQCACHNNLPRNTRHSEPILHEQNFVITTNGSTQIVSRRVQFATDIETDGGGARDNKLSENQFVPASSDSRQETEITSTASSRNKSQGYLQCPNCNKVFTEQLHVQFLEHFERCQQKSILKS